MRVLQVINNLNVAGAESLVGNSSVLLKKSGVDVEVLTLSKTKDAQIINNLRLNDVNVVELNKRYRFDPRIVYYLREKNYNGKYDIIHAHLYPVIYYTALCKRLQSRLLLTEHSSINRRRGKSIIRPIDKFIYGRYDKIICISDTVKNSLSKWLPWLSPRMVRLYNGIDSEPLNNSKPYDKATFGIPNDHHVVIMVSRLEEPPKDYSTLIKAVGLIENLYLIIAGEGPSERALRRLALSLEISNRVLFLGKRQDVGSLIKTADIYVHSSMHEGFGLAVVEAMACGVPVIASNIDASVEVLGSEPSGLIFRTGNAQELAGKIKTLLLNGNLRSELNAAGKKRAQLFSIENHVKGLLKIYHSVL